MKKLEIKDFLNYRYLSRLEYAPGGKNAAFVVTRADWDSNGYKSDIWLLDAENERVYRLTAGGDAKSFVWLNEHELVFTAVREAKDKERLKKGERFTVFYRLCLFGGEAQEWFRVPYTVTGFKKICEKRFAMICAWHPEDPDFASMDEAQKAAALKTIEENRDYEVLDEIPFWGNGAGFTNKRRSRLFVFDTESGSGEFATCELTNVGHYSAEGGKIAYTANTFKDKMELQSGAYVYDLESKTTETLIAPAIGGLRPGFIDFWHGGYIIKGSDGQKHGNGEYGNFYTHKDGKLELLREMDEATGNFTNSDSRYGGGTTIKVVDGSLYYCCVDHVDNALRRLDKDGSLETLLKQADTIDGFDVSGDKIIYFGLGAVTLHEIFKLESGAPRKLTDFNTEFLSSLVLQKPERCDAQGEWETVEGFVLKPVGYEEGKKYPAILHIHGGPKTAFGDSYFHEMHMWSARGYFVLFCNPWGSDGRGDDFADLRGRYGTVDYNDLMTFTDKCLEKYPAIDPKRVAVTGGSYGGYMTNWIIGHTDRFVCAASQRSIANWISKFGTTDIGYYFNADQQQSTPWDNHDKMWWHSPMKYADKCVTPTLFIHSEEDYRCWLTEGLQMYTSLRYHGVDARLCMFRGENHELSRSGKPRHRVRRMEEIVGWFDKYTKE